MSDTESDKGKRPLLDFTGEHPEDAALYAKMPPPGDEEELPAPDEWVDILGSGRLKKKVLVPGEDESRPDFGQEVFVHYTMRLDGSDEILHNSRESGTGEPLAFRVGENDVIIGWDLGVALMDKGEKSLLYVDSCYAYGDLGLESPRVPPKASLVYEIELVDFGRPPVDLDETSAAERIQIATEKKERGNALYKRKEYDGAVKSYNFAITVLKHEADEKIDEETQKQLDALRVTLLNNLCQAQIQYGNFERARETCKQALAMDSDNVKAMYRMGVIHNHFKNFNDAKEVLSRAAEMAPDDKLIRAALNKALDGKTQQSVDEKKLAEAMLRGYAPPKDAQTDSEIDDVPAREKSTTAQCAAIGAILAVLAAVVVGVLQATSA